MVIISVDGIIGAGKSTLLEFLNRNHCFNIKLEPIENWKPYLERIYKYNDQYYEFQKQIWKDICCYENENGNENNVITIIERSGFFIRNTFLLHLYKNNKITNEEYLDILSLHKEKDNKPIIMIYLKISPEKALERIKMRNRENENYINIEYLYDLYKLNEEAYSLCKKLGYNIYVIDSEKDIKNIVNDFLDIMEMNNITVSS